MSSRDVASGRLSGSGGLPLIGAICQQGALFATTWLIARDLGTHELGRYALAFATLSVLGLVALCGFRATLTRFVAIHLADDDAAALRGTVRLCISVSATLSILIAVALAFFAPQVAHVFNDPDLGGGIRLTALTLPAVTLRETALAATQGWRDQRAFTLIGWIYEPLARLGLTAAALFLSQGLAGALLALVVSSWTAALAALFALRRRMRSVGQMRAAVSSGTIFGYSMVSWVTTLASTGLLWADTLILGHLSTAESVGIYVVSTRLVTLATIAMAPIDAIYAPQFAHLFHREEYALLSSAYTSATNWTLRLSLPAITILVLFPVGLLDVFGTGYASGALVTVILAGGQLVNAGTGPCGMLLNMCGRVRLNLVNNLVTLILNISLNLYLIPRYGIVGAAAAWTFSLAGVNVARVAQVYLLLRRLPFDRHTAQTVLATSVAAVIGLVFRYVGGQDFATWTTGAFAVVLVYAAVTLLTLDEHDQDVVARWLRRTRPS